MKNKKIQFIFLSLWILLTRAFDAYCTYQHTPKLDKEANPLVTLLGMSWLPLLGFIGLLLLYVLYSYAQRLFYFESLDPEEKGYSFGEYWTYVYLGKRARPYAMFHQLPKSISRFNQYMGALMPWALAYAGLISTVMWLLIRHTTFYPPIHSAPLIYFLLVSGCFLMMYMWTARGYGRYIVA